MNNSLDEFADKYIAIPKWLFYSLVVVMIGMAGLLIITLIYMGVQMAFAEIGEGTNYIIELADRMTVTDQLTEGVKYKVLIEESVGTADWFR